MKSDTQTEPETVRVLVADNQVLARHALRCLIEAGGSFRVVAEAATVGQIAEHARRAAVDVIAVDFGLSGLDELETVPWRGRPDAPAIVVIARHHGSADLDRALQLGADGYVTKNDDPDVLYLALREAVSGRSFLSPRVTGTVLDSLVERDSSPGCTTRPGTAGTTTPAHDPNADTD